MRDRVDSKDECFLVFHNFAEPYDPRERWGGKFRHFRKASDPLSKLIKYLTIKDYGAKSRDEDERELRAVYDFKSSYTYEHVGSLPHEVDLSKFKLRYVAKFSLPSQLVNRLIYLLKSEAGRYIEWQGVTYFKPGNTKRIHAEARQALKDHCLFINCELYNPKEQKWYVLNSMYDATPRNICALV